MSCHLIITISANGKTFSIITADFLFGLHFSYWVFRNESRKKIAISLFIASVCYLDLFDCKVAF